MLLLIILLLSAVARFYLLSQSFVFTIDEEYLTTFALTLVHHIHPLLIGLSVSVGFYLGPGLIYLVAFLLWISKNNPLILAYFSATLGVVTTFAVYYVGKDLFNKKSGIIAGFLYATAPLIVFYDQRFWNDTFIPLLSLIFFYSLVKSFKNPKWWIVFGLSFGLMFHIHLSLVPYILLAIYGLFLQRKKLDWKILSISGLGFLIIYSPLLVFDFIHNWDNLSLPYKLLFGSKSSFTGSSPISHLNSYFQTLGRIWYLQPGSAIADQNEWGCTTLSGINVQPFVEKVTTHTYPPLIISLVSSLTVLWFFLKTNFWSDINSRFLGLSFLLISGFFLIFPGGALEYYLVGIFPLVPLMIGIILAKVKTPIAYGLVGLYCLFGLWVVFSANREFGLFYQQELIQKVNQNIGSANFELDKGIDGCHQYSGWRYLFGAYGKLPVKSYTDSTFDWLYIKPLPQGKADYTVVINEKRLINQTAPDNTHVIDSGGYEAWITSNSVKNPE